MNALEEGAQLNLDFKKLTKVAAVGALIPVVVQEAKTQTVLMVAYVNEEALLLSQKEGRVVLYSTSRNQLWRKGEISGDQLRLKEIRINCEQNALLFLVEKKQAGMCHTRDADGQTRPTCFYRRLTEKNTLEMI